MRPLSVGRAVYWKMPALRVGPCRAPPDEVTPEELRRRLAAFATRVEAFSRPLLSAAASRDQAMQLRRAASSTAANHRAAGRGRSHAEFTSKLGIALEEADNCRLAPVEHLKPLIREAKELVAILTTSAHTARRRGKNR